jgi:LysM repeat protein
MKNGLPQAMRQISVVLLMMLLGIFAATLSYSAPSEENISGSSPLRTPPLGSSAEGTHSTWSEPSSDNPPPDESDQGTTGEEGGRLPTAVSAAGSVSPPRATFPYTVRPGDTPGGIAAIFGVPVADLLRLNHLRQDSELMIGDSLRVPNPFLAREREVSSKLDRLTAEEQAAEGRTRKGQQMVADLRAQVQDLTSSNKQYRHDLNVLPWWRAAALLAAGGAALMLAITLVAVIQCIITRIRFRAVAEMNESLRRLDYKYKAALAKAELRFQELYGRRRRGVQEGQELSKTPEEIEIEQLNRRLKEVLEHHLQRLDTASSSAGRARWRERLAGIGAPMEARSFRR